MRIVTATRVLAMLALVAGAVAPAGAASPPAPGLEGHWRCTGSAIPVTERSFYTVGPWAARTVREIFSAADRTLPNGTPVTDFERIAETPDGTIRVESVDGSGTLSAPTATQWRFTGRSFDDAAPFTLTYSLEGSTLHRVATRGASTVDDERCTREPVAPVATCANPNVAARTVHADEPEYPDEAVPKRASGTVYVRVVLDDRSRVLWADVMQSPDPSLDRSALITARDATYQTAVRDCRPIAAVYVFGVEYSFR
jgi:TonB family protein